MLQHDPFGKQLPELQTERLTLRHPQPKDLDGLWVIFSSKELMRYWSHEPWTDRSEAQKYLDEINQGFEKRSLFQWAVTEKGQDRLIGTVTVMNWDRTNRHVEIGYILAKDSWGNGFAIEAVRRVLSFVFDELDVHRVEAELDPRNIGSARLLERLGFSKEGLLAERWFLFDESCDSALYGLLSRDFVKR